MNRSGPWLRAIQLAALLVASDAMANAGRQCSDPCLDSARAERSACISSASGVFLDTVIGCVERDHQCVDACRADHQDCRDATSLGVDLAACDVELEARKVRCRTNFRPGSTRLVICIANAQVAGFRCRRGAAHDLRTELRACRSSSNQCVDACGPGGPPGGGDTCRAEGKSALRAALNDCRLVHRATASACLAKDIPCLQDCDEARESCDAPTTAALDAALASCTAQRNAALAACGAANPGGGSALDECVSAAQAAATACRQAAREASVPGFQLCTDAFVSCARDCPPA